MSYSYHQPSEVLTLDDVFEGSIALGVPKEINKARLKAYISQETKISSDDRYLTDMVDALLIEVDSWDDVGSDQLMKALQVILLEDASNDADIQRFKDAAASARSGGGYNASNSRRNYDPYYSSSSALYWDPYPNYYCWWYLSSPGYHDHHDSGCCDGGSGGGSGNDCKADGDACLVIAAIICACSCFIAAGCACSELIKSSSESEPKVATAIKRVSPVAIGAVSLWLMIQHVNASMNEYLCKKFATDRGHYNPANGTLPVNATWCGTYPDDVKGLLGANSLTYSTDLIVMLFAFSLAACALSSWKPRKPVPRTKGDYLRMMQDHADELRKDPAVNRLVRELKSDSNFVSYLKGAKEKGEVQYKAVQIIIEALCRSLDATNQVVIDVHSGEYRAPAEVSQNPLGGGFAPSAPPIAQMPLASGSWAASGSVNGRGVLKESVYS